MTDKQQGSIEAMNAELALFMGARYWPKSKSLFVKYSDAYEFRFKDKYGNEAGIAFGIDQLQYHSSWSELMPCVEKIQALGYAVNIYGESEKGLKVQFNHCDILKDNEAVFEGCSDKSKIKAVHEAVYQFIQWCNKQNDNGEAGV